jgi:hypothetical protein
MGMRKVVWLYKRRYRWPWVLYQLVYFDSPMLIVFVGQFAYLGIIPFAILHQRLEICNQTQALGNTSGRIEDPPREHNPLVQQTNQTHKGKKR